MTWHWRKSKACDLDELLDDLNPAMKDLEGEMQGVGGGDNPTYETVTTNALILPPVAQPDADGVNLIGYYDEDSGLMEVVFPGGARGRWLVDFDDDEWPQTNAVPVFYDAHVLATGDRSGRAYGYLWTDMRAGGEPAQVVSYLPLFAEGDFWVQLKGFRNIQGAPGAWAGGAWAGYCARSIVRFRAGVDDAATSAVVTVQVQYTHFDVNGSSNRFEGDVYLVVTPKSPPEDDVELADWADLVGTKASNDVFDARSLVVDQVLTFNLNAAGLAYLQTSIIDGEIMYDFALAFSLDNDDLQPTVPDDATGDQGIIEIQFYGSMTNALAKRPTLVLTP